MAFEILETTDDTYSTDLFDTEEEDLTSSLDSEEDDTENDEIDGPFASYCCDYSVYSTL